MFLEPITVENTYYPAIDREWDIIAGKFSGTFGAVVPMDELVIKYPEYVGGSGNHLRTHFGLLSWPHDVNKNDDYRFHDIAQIDDRITYTALIKADFLNESLIVGEPEVQHQATNASYVSILQMAPYHVDNLTYTSGAMGTDLTMEPHNFNLRTGSAISYTNTTSSSEKKSVAYSMTSKAETIFAIDNPALEKGAAGFQAVRGITTTLFGDTPVGKAIEGIGQAWDALCDHVETTKTNSNENEVTHMLTTTNMADYLDELYFTAEWHHIWCYPVSMIPDFANSGDIDTSLSFDQADVLDKQTYITFAMSEPGNLQPTLSVNDNLYQPYHEEGNLFSYPPSLAMVEGYGGNKSLYGARTWAGGNFDEHLTFTKTETTQESTQTVNKPGAVTKFLSFVDNIAGTNMAKVPADTLSSFARSVSNQEEIHVTLPTAYSNGAGFTADFQPYIDVAGTTTFSFAVRGFTEDELWTSKPDAHTGRKGSLYQRKPDPAFLMPQKFHTTDGQTFTANAYEGTAMKIRGVRFIVADYNQYSNNLLVKGLKYKIRVPVFNASFVDTPADKPLKVRMSLAKKNDWNPERTTIAEYTFPGILPGCGNGQHRQWAEFE